MSTWRGDALVVAACAAAVLASATAFGPARGVARVALIETRDGQSARMALDHDATLSIVGRRGPSTIEVRAGRARFVDSPCPQKLCVRAGWLERAGDSSACVPNGVSLRLLGDDPAYDAITY